MYHFTLATKKTANTEPKYNGDIIWDESDGPKHLKFWTGEKYERLSDMVQQEIKKHNGSVKIISSTPETDIAEYYIRGEGNFVRSDICRKLERERDEAREALDCLLAVIGLTPIAGNKHALQEAVDNGLAVLRKQKEAAK